MICLYTRYKYSLRLSFWHMWFLHVTQFLFVIGWDVAKHPLHSRYQITYIRVIIVKTRLHTTIDRADLWFRYMLSTRNILRSDLCAYCPYSSSYCLLLNMRLNHKSTQLIAVSKRTLKEQCHRVRILSAHSQTWNSTLVEYQVTLFKMATAPSATHGGKRRNSGRKRKYEKSSSAQLAWNRQHKQIYLSVTIFKSWNEAKNEAGYGSSTDSGFAAHSICTTTFTTQHVFTLARASSALIAFLSQGTRALAFTRRILS